MHALTQEQYWSNVWSLNRADLRPIEPQTAQYLEREYHRFFRLALAGRTGRILEVGCASSRWLPYFALEFGFDVAGIDYSPIGCLQATACLRQVGIEGEIFCCDALADNAGLFGVFDVVISLGLVEHFQDTGEIVKSLARYVKPGGLLISTAPNLAGILGAIQRAVNRPVFDGHLPFSLDHLLDAHRNAKLVIDRAAYLGGLDFHSINTYGIGNARLLLSRVLMRLSRIGWKAPFSMPRDRLWSSAMAVSATKPG